MNQPGESDWDALYQAALAFKKSSPWTWMSNGDFFAVENPYDGEVGYCSVLGHAGQEFGLGIFMGTAGYQGFIRVLEGAVEPEDFEEVVMMPSISMLFTDRNSLRKEDYEVIRSLGLSFRGRNEWPLFRSQRPGYVAWFLEKEEALFLTAAIQQTLQVARRLQNGDLNLGEGQQPDAVLTSCYRDGNWLDEWRQPPEQQKFDSEGITPVAEAELHLLHNRTGQPTGRWELDIFLMPVSILSTTDRPYYPVLFLIVDSETGMIIDANLTEPWLTLSQKREEVIRMLKKMNQLPAKMQVKSAGVRRIVEPVTRLLGIKLSVGSLPRLKKARTALEERFSER